MRDCTASYEMRKKSYESLLKKQSGYANVISNTRLAVFAGGLGALTAAFLTGYYILFGALALAFLILFIYLVLLHDRLIKNERYTSLLIGINGECLERLKGGWTGFQDNGAEFADEGHSFTGDLDIFGKGSLFQWTSCAKTYFGRKHLARLLSGDTGAPGEMEERREAVWELADRLAWRQRLLAEGKALAKASENPEALIKWAEEEDVHYSGTAVVLAIRLLPIATAVLAVLAFAFSLAPWYVPTAGLLLQYVLLKLRTRRNAVIFELAEKYGEGIKIYSRMLKRFEKQSFRAERLKALKKRLTGGNGASAYRRVERLAAVIDLISNRHNPFYLIFNIIALWDYQNLIALERWKKDSGGLLGDWLAAIGEAEALCSLALIRHDHPEWARPEIIEGENGYEAAGMRHPLLNSEKRVDNDMRIQSPVRVMLVTGSNMSGKSTFLRTAGINLVLAYAGAPVCAKKFRAPLMEIYTCMRIGDNLEKSISSFYAELVRIKSIVDAVSEGRRVFFLLDEIFKGTNSADRHAGASVLIKKLSASDSLGMVSTHDLELCNLAEENERVENRHFREYYNADGIYFDYRLRPGASTTRNAAYLMKLAGIDVCD